MDFMREISTNLEDVPQRVLALGEPILIVYDCYIVERRTDSGFVYLAVNPNNGGIEILSRRKTFIGSNDTNALDTLIMKLKQSGIAGYGWLSADRKFGEQISLNKCKEIMEVIFGEILPQYGFTVRQAQVELAEEILDALNRRQIMLAEGETGTGKTWAYLIAAILIKRGRTNDYWNMGYYPKIQYMDMAYMPIVVSTSSIALQKALVNDYIPMLSRILLAHGIIDTPITAVLRKGRGHYICERKLRTAIANEDDWAVREVYTDVLKNLKNQIDLSEISYLNAYGKRKICVPARCSYDCRYYETCAYMGFRTEAQSNKIDIQVCNHQYLLADTLNRAGGRPPLIPNYQSIIIDEAHKFYQAAQSMYGVEFSDCLADEIKESINQLRFRSEKNSIAPRKLAKKLNDESKRLFRELMQNGGQSAFADFDKSADESEKLTVEITNKAVCHMLNMLDISEELASILENSKVAADSADFLPQILREIENLRNRLDTILDVEDFIFWLEMDGMSGTGEASGLDYTREIRLCTIPKNLSQFIYTDLFGKSIPIVLTSGTISANGDFSHIKRQLGIDAMGWKQTETTKPSPFDYKNNTMLYISENLPFPNNKDFDYIFSLANEIEELLLASHGHAAVLFTSYRAMDMVWEHLSDRGIPFPMFRMDKGGTHAIENFKASGNGVLFASGSMWEGIDIPGDTLSMLIIAKLPFDAPDPISEYERTKYVDMVDFKRRYIIPEMLIKLKQGFGRLIRTVKCSGVVAILDCRAGKHGSCRRCIVETLPKCHITDSISIVEQFYQYMKPAEYHK